MIYYIYSKLRCWSTSVKIDVILWSFAGWETFEDVWMILNDEHAKISSTLNCPPCEELTQHLRCSLVLLAPQRPTRVWRHRSARYSDQWVPPSGRHQPSNQVFIRNLSGWPFYHLALQRSAFHQGNVQRIIFNNEWTASAFGRIWTKRNCCIKQHESTWINISFVLCFSIDPTA